jgi:hypothetical protein
MALGAEGEQPGIVESSCEGDRVTVEAAAPLLAGAFTLVRGATSLVLDLRDNIGGDPATVAVIVDWLAGGPPRHLSDVVYRDHTRQWWTGGSPVAELLQRHTS